jgi:membrane protein
MKRLGAEMVQLRRIVLYALVAATLGHVAARLRADVDTTVSRVEGGRYAETPLQMTWIGWRAIVARSIANAINDRIMTVAASVAFYALLSLVPGLSVLITIYGLFVTPSSIPGQIAALTNFFPDAAKSLIQEQAIRLTSQPAGSLSVTLLISLAIAAWSANAAIKAIFEALNIMWGRVDTRSFLRLNLETLLFTFVGILLLMLVLIAMADIPGYLSFLPIDANLQATIALIRWPLVYVAGLAAIVMVYRRGPCRTPPGVVWSLPGAIFASLIWGGASVLFSWYVSTLARYSATYGSLAAVVVTMTWLWLSAIILLAGAELNAQIESQIDHDEESAPANSAAFGAVSR